MMILKAIASLILSFLIWWLIFSFIEWDFNLAHWGGLGRILFGVFGVISWGKIMEEWL